MTVEVHVEWNGEIRRAGSLHPAGRGPAVTFVYADEWLRAPDAFALDPTNLPLLFGAFQDCDPDSWGRLLIERAVRREVLPRQAYQDLDFVLALDDASRIGALRFRRSPDSPFLAASGGRIPPLVQLAAAPRFGLRPEVVRADLAGLVAAVGEWRAVGRQLGLKAGTLAAYESAFEHPLMDEARRLSGA